MTTPAPSALRPPRAPSSERIRRTALLAFALVVGPTGGGLAPDASAQTRDAVADPAELIEDGLALQETRTRERWQEAAGLFRAAFEAAERSGAALLEARARLHLGVGYQTMGFTDSARVHLSAALPVLRTSGTVEERAEAGMWLASVYRAQAYREGWENEFGTLMTEVTPLVEESGDPALVARSLMRAWQWGVSVRGDVEGSRRIAAASLEAAQQADSPLLEAEALVALGNTDLDLGQTDAALLAYQRVDSIGTSVGVPSIVAQARWSLGDLEVARGRPDSALSHYRVGLAAAQRAPEIYREASLLRQMASAHSWWPLRIAVPRAVR